MSFISSYQAKTVESLNPNIKILKSSDGLLRGTFTVHGRHFKVTVRTKETTNVAWDEKGQETIQRIIHLLHAKKLLKNENPLNPLNVKIGQKGIKHLRHQSLLTSTTPHQGENQEIDTQKEYQDLIDFLKKKEQAPLFERREPIEIRTNPGKSLNTSLTKDLEQEGLNTTIYQSFTSNQFNIPNACDTHGEIHSNTEEEEEYEKFATAREDGNVELSVQNTLQEELNDPADEQREAIQSPLRKETTTDILNASFIDIRKTEENEENPPFDESDLFDIQELANSRLHLDLSQSVLEKHPSSQSSLLNINVEDLNNSEEKIKLCPTTHTEIETLLNKKEIMHENQSLDNDKEISKETTISNINQPAQDEKSAENSLKAPMNIDHDQNINPIDKETATKKFTLTRLIVDKLTYGNLFSHLRDLHTKENDSSK